MLLNFFYLFTSIFGFVVIYLLGCKFKSKGNSNAYLIIFFFLSSIRFFFYGFTFVPFVSQKVIYFDILFNVTSWPCLYLYFNNLLNNRNSIRLKEMFHFIIPLVLFFCFCIKSVVVSNIMELSKAAFFIVISLNCFYFYSSYQLLLNNVWKRKSNILLINSQFIVLRKWTKLLFLLFSLMSIRVLIKVVLNDLTFWYSNHNYYLWIGALFWTYLFLKIVTAPVLLYGYNLLQSRIKQYDQNTVTFNNLWMASTQVLNVQDAVLKNRLTPKIQDYIIEIERVSLNTDLFLSNGLSLIDLANKLNIPKSHLFYVFKYHCKLSFSDFKKMIRIQKAVSMMGEGYLKTNTMEALAIEVGFSSYSPFFKSFKTITGESPHVYLKIKDTFPKIIKRNELANDYAAAISFSTER